MEIQDIPIRRVICRFLTEQNPLFRAVIFDDFQNFKELLETGGSVNTRNRRGQSLLNSVMHWRRKNMFDYLLNLAETDLAFTDIGLQNPLMFCVGTEWSIDTEYFALELIKKGVDINQQAKEGITPLYVACQNSNFNAASLLLYFEADPTITDDYGVLPLAAMVMKFPEPEEEIVEILCNYTFDNNKVPVRLSTIVAAMTSNGILFDKILSHASEIIYEPSDLCYMAMTLKSVKPKHLKLFAQNFGYILKDLVEGFPLMDYLIAYYSDCESVELCEIIQILLRKEYATNFINSIDPSKPTISTLLKELNQGRQWSDELDEPRQFIEDEEFTKTICLLLTCGLSVTSEDLNTVYDFYGYCELFKILFHMDIVITERRSLATIFYDPLVDIEHLPEDISLYHSLLSYYNNPRLKNYILANSDQHEVIERVAQLAQVPSLLELSRNMARKHIIQKNNIVSSRQFYTALQSLPIGEMNKRIIALEIKLYVV